MVISAWAHAFAFHDGTKTLRKAGLDRPTFGSPWFKATLSAAPEEAFSHTGLARSLLAALILEDVCLSPPLRGMPLDLDKPLPSLGYDKRDRILCSSQGSATSRFEGRAGMTCRPIEHAISTLCVQATEAGADACQASSAMVVRGTEAGLVTLISIAAIATRQSNVCLPFAKSMLTEVKPE